MKLAIITFFISIQFGLQIDVVEVRNLYKSAGTSKEKTSELMGLLQNVDKNDDMVLLAYKGAVTAMMAKYEKTISEKKQEFIKGVSLVEFALEQEPKNVEIVFVRLSLQQNSPKILKYKNNIDQDKAYLLTQFNQIKSTSLKAYLEDYILHSNNFSEEEKNVISQS